MNHFASQLFPNLSTVSKSPFFLHMLLFILQTKWSQPSDHCTLPLAFLFTTSAAGFSELLAGHLAGKIFSVSIAACSWKNLPCCFIHSFSKPTYSCSGSHGAGDLSQHALSGRKEMRCSYAGAQSNHQFHTYGQSVLIYYYYIIDVQ